LSESLLAAAKHDHIGSVVKKIEGDCAPDVARRSGD
jgi:hypothetical protein